MSRGELETAHDIYNKFILDLYRFDLITDEEVAKHCKLALLKLHPDKHDGSNSGFQKYFPIIKKLKERLLELPPEERKNVVAGLNPRPEKKESKAETEAASSYAAEKSEPKKYYQHSYHPGLTLEEYYSNLMEDLNNLSNFDLNKSDYFSRRGKETIISTFCIRCIESKEAEKLKACKFLSNVCIELVKKGRIEDLDGIFCYLTGEESFETIKMLCEELHNEKNDSGKIAFDIMIINLLDTQKEEGFFKLRESLKEVGQIKHIFSSALLDLANDNKNTLGFFSRFIQKADSLEKGKSDFLESCKSFLIGSMPFLKDKTPFLDDLFAGEWRCYR